MLNQFHRRIALPGQWLPAAGLLLILPCILALLLDLHPGTTYTDHLPSAILLLVTGLALTLSPLPPDTTKDTVPTEHKDVLAYALRTGALPIASLFSDWRCEVTRQGRTYSWALRILPTATAVATALGLYAVLIDPAGSLFFLLSAAATLTFGLGAYVFSAIRITNARLLEDKLCRQVRLLEVTTGWMLEEPHE
ncbi:hypothetical protein [Arthrobacter sp.]|uniref:hypothetical protein n=1 Tax=Arthrobacter sp. TaxID=1667 RepID=UPI0028114151|nr:hypothetical protein [Arthrobacter sp.]